MCRFLSIACFILIAQFSQAQHWHPVPGQIPGAKLTGIAAMDSSPAIVAATLASGIFRSIDSGTTWQHVHTLQDTIFSLTSLDGKHFCAGGKGFTLTSSDSGFTWTSHLFPFHIAVGRLEFHPSGALIAGTGSKWDLNAIGGKGVWLSLDTGKTWSSLNTGITKPDPLIEALAISDSGIVLAGIYDNNVGLAGKYGIMKLDSINGTWQRLSISVNAPFNQSYDDQNLRIGSVFNINIIDGQVLSSITGVYINFAYAFTIQKSVQDIDNAASFWQVKWVVDSIPSTGSFYEHIVNVFKDSHDTLWASVSDPGNEIFNNIYTGPVTVTAPWTLNMDSITMQTGRFLFAEAANGLLYTTAYFTGDEIFTRSVSATTEIQESMHLPNYKWHLFPNPASDLIFISRPQNTAETLQLTLYDVMGNTILEKYVNNDKVVLIPFEDRMAAGIYILSVTTGKESQVLRFIKN